MRWELDIQEAAYLRNYKDIVAELLLTHLEPINGNRIDEFHLTATDLLLYTWGIEDLAVGRVNAALSMFEHRLLEETTEDRPIWKALLLLWSTVCRLYLCDPDTAWNHISKAEEERYTDLILDFYFHKGLALRLKGDHTAAISVLNKYIASRPEGYMKKLATALLYETMVAGHLGSIPSDAIPWLNQEGRMSNWQLGLITAARYRIEKSLPDSLENAERIEELLQLLDRTFAFQRPMLTMLLIDILPRPLAGVQEATKAIEDQWLK